MTEPGYILPLLVGVLIGVVTACGLIVGMWIQGISVDQMIADAVSNSQDQG